MSFSVNSTVAKLDRLLAEIGETGMRLAEMKACEGTAGNISVGSSEDLDPAGHFTQAASYELPEAFPELANRSFLVTGSGCRLRDIAREPEANLGLIKLKSDGRTGQLFSGRNRHFTRLTSEFYSHLVLHQRAFRDQNVTFHAIVHAQPRHLTYLTHIPRYQNARQLSEAIVRWQPELSLIFPVGLAYVPFEVPNSDELAAQTRLANPDCDLIVWEKHGVLALSRQDVLKAFDLVEYAETGASYEFLNLIYGEAGDGLLPEQISAVRRHFKVPDQPNDLNA